MVIRFAYDTNIVDNYSDSLWKLKQYMYLFRQVSVQFIGVGRGGRRGGGGQAPNNLRGGPTYPLAPPPPNNPPTCTGKTIPLNSILEFSIISYFKMRNVIIWHRFIKNLVAIRRRNDVHATSLRRIDVVTTSCVCLLEIWPPFPSPPPPKKI